MKANLISGLLSLYCFSLAWAGNPAPKARQAGSDAPSASASKTKNRAPSYWTLTTRYEKREDSDIKASVVEFRRQGATSLYKPNQPPWGLVSSRRLLLDKEELFITTWAHGAKSVVYRVFSPEKWGTSPLCESVSFSEATELRNSAKALEIEVLKSPESPKQWEKCHRPQSAKIDREP